MPTSVDSSLSVIPTGQGATTVLTPTSVSTIPSVTPSIQPMQSKDTTWTKLFVGGLPYHTTDKSLREHFEVFGDIEEAVVITDRSTGKSRGYGFVIMSCKESAERACKEPNPIIDGRKANVNLAIIGAKPRGNLTASLPMTALRPGFPTIIPSPQYGQGMPASGAGQANPYLQQLYTAGTPYMHPSLLSLAGLQTTGNPLMDIYSQYAAAAAAAGFQTAPAPATVTQGMVPGVQQTNGLDTNAMAAAPGGYFGYYSPFTAQQLTAAAGLSGMPYAAAAPSTAAVQAQPAPQPAEARIQ